MKYFLAMVLVTLLSAAGTRAQTPGHLGLYSDANRSDCRVLEIYPGIYEVFVIHELASDVAGAVFSVPVPSCASVSWISDETDFLQIGLSPAGVVVAYGACRISPIVALKILYMGSANQDCCPLMIEGHTLSGEPPYPAAIVCVSPPPDFDFRDEPVTVSPAYFNSNATCGCTVLAQETTWGKVKALYIE